MGVFCPFVPSRKLCKLLPLSCAFSTSEKWKRRRLGEAGWGSSTR